MKVAIAHDHLISYGGSERVFRRILQHFPEADIFCLTHGDLSNWSWLLGRKITSSFLQRLPWVHRYHRLLFPWYPRAIASLDISGYDLVISSSHSAAKAVQTRPDQIHICYCHSPARWAWDLQDEYIEAAGLPKWIRPLLRKRLKKYRTWDASSNDGVTKFLANSQYIADRIQRCYGRDASVVYPPVVVPDTYGSGQRGGLLVVTRLVWYKQVTALVAAMRQLPQQHLIVIGEGPQRSDLEHDAPANVEFLGHVDERQLQEALAKAQAFVFVATEDFGIAMVEAQAADTPVIGFHLGGAAEIVTPQTGRLVHDRDPATLALAIQSLLENPCEPGACHSNAKRFSLEAFDQSFKQEVESACPPALRGQLPWNQRT